jgi:hypothetical protein
MFGGRGGDYVNLRVNVELDKVRNRYFNQKWACMTTFKILNLFLQTV